MSVLAERPVEHLGVLDDALAAPGLGDRGDPVLQAPAHQHLCGRPADAPGDLRDRRVAQQAAVPKWAVGLQHHAEVPVGPQLGGRPDLRVPLDLVDHRRHLRPLDRPAEEVGAVVGDADRAGEPVGVQALELRPERLGAATGPVDQVEVDPVEPEPAEAGLELAARLAAAGAELGRHEHVVPRQPARAQPPPDALLVAVRGGRVDVPVARLERPEHGLLGLPRRDPPHAQPEQRHQGVVGQPERGRSGQEPLGCRSAGHGSPPVVGYRNTVGLLPRARPTR